MDAEKEKQEGIQGQWQRESPAKEFLENKVVRTQTAKTEIGRNTKASSRLE